MRRLIAFCVVIMLLCTSYTKAGDWTTLDYLLTEAYGISDRNVVGWYMESSGLHGFSYNGFVRTTLDMPGATVTIVNCWSA